MISIVGYFCLKLKFASWTLRNVWRVQASPADLIVKIKLEVGAFSLICQMFAEFTRNWWCDFYPCFYSDKCINSGCGFFPYVLMFFDNLFLYMSSVCLADVQDFWILLWIIFFTIMITACLEVLSQTDIYNSWMLLFSYLWLIIFDLLLLHTVGHYFQPIRSGLRLFIWNTTCVLFFMLMWNFCGIQNNMDDHRANTSPFYDPTSVPSNQLFT